MSLITINIPDEKITEVLNAFDSVFPGRVLPMTRKEWVEKRLLAVMRDVVKQSRYQVAQKTVNSKVDLS